MASKYHEHPPSLTHVGWKTSWRKRHECPIQLYMDKYRYYKNIGCQQPNTQGFEGNKIWEELSFWLIGSSSIFNTQIKIPTLEFHWITNHFLKFLSVLNLLWECTSMRMSKGLASMLDVTMQQPNVIWRAISQQLYDENEFEYYKPEKSLNKFKKLI